MAIKRICGTCLHYHPEKPFNPQCLKLKCNNSVLRPNWKPREMDCPICGASMVWKAEKTFLRCDDCGTWVNPFVNDMSPRRAVREVFEENLPCTRSKEVSNPTIHVKTTVGGGSKSRRRKGSDQLMKKQTRAAINSSLANSKNPKPRKPFEPGKTRAERGRPKKIIDNGVDNP